MKWTYYIENKLVASAVLFSLGILVLVSNFIDRNHTNNVKITISTLYEDRLIAEAYILKMTSGIYQIKEILNANVNDTSKINSVNNILLNITEASNAYEKTKFTEAEITKAEEWFKILDQLGSIELNKTRQKLETANKALSILNELSAIQLEESKQIMQSAEELYLSGKISSQFVFVIIIIILLTLQALVFTSRTLTPRNRTKTPHLN